MQLPEALSSIGSIGCTGCIGSIEAHNKFSRKNRCRAAKGSGPIVKPLRAQARMLCIYATRVYPHIYGRYKG